jgi:hypothetical protein
MLVYGMDVLTSHSWRAFGNGSTFLGDYTADRTIMALRLILQKNE